TEVTNSPELRVAVRDGAIDAALIRAELVMEPFTLLAAANRAVHYASHNRMATRSLHAELIYSLSPSKNITDSLVTFGLAEDSANLIVVVFDDAKGDKLAAVAKKIKGRSVPLENLKNITNYDLIKK
uniref:Uncharacterized protein n=1 Tax=Plectus sambesii TaxID=2011161 RepID=A0A914V5D3_9BILA